MLDQKLVREGEQMMRICNSCRYCEGYCAVWPAMEFRRIFDEKELVYLANLCHDCGDCYYACQYAPPHEFDINPPLTFSKIRSSSYEKYAWPNVLASAFRANGLVVSLLALMVLFAFAYGAVVIKGTEVLTTAHPGGDFYQIVSHNFMVGAFGLAGLLVALSMAVGLVRYWRDMGEKVSDLFNPVALGVAVKEILKLKYLDGNGWGCMYPAEEGSQSRRLFHHFTFYGFLLCLAATTIGCIFHYVFGWHGPYSYYSLPVILGTLGGIGLLVGPVGLLQLKLRRNREISDNSKIGMDMVFLVLLFLVSLSGLLLLFLRGTSALGTMTILHLGLVMALFLTMPFGKFVHSLLRAAAIIKYAHERNRKKIIGA